MTLNNINNNPNIRVGFNNFIHSRDLFRSRTANSDFFGSNTAGTSPDFRANLTAMSNSANAMINSINTILGVGRDNNSPFNSLVPVSGDADTLTIRSHDSNRLRHANIRDMSVEVLQLAQNQVNRGDALAADGLDFGVGNHHLAITVDGRQFDINVSVSANDTNRDVQNRIASAINQRTGSTGVEASVAFDSATGRSTLSLQSEGEFSVSSNAGNALAATGVGAVTQNAQNAQFRVNRNGFTGALQTSRTNDVDLGFGISATLRSTGTAEVNMSRDITGQQNALRGMVNSFNDMMQAARDAGGGRLERELNSIARTFAGALNRVGIFTNQSGWLDIDEDRMQQSAERGDLDRFAARDSFGSGANFLNRMERLANNVSRNPQAFAPQENAALSGRRMNANFFNQINRLNNAGMLFDAFM